MSATVEINDGIGRIRMDDGKVNALSQKMLESVQAALAKVEAAKAIAVIEGRPGIFSAGFDLKTLQAGSDAAVGMVKAEIETLVKLLSFPTPVVTVCAGHAYPAGAFFMLCADVRFGIEGDFRIGLNETAIGLILPEWALSIARHKLVPSAQVAVHTGRMYTPKDAVAAGYLDHVAPAGGIGAALDAELARLKKIDLNAFAEVKRRLNRNLINAIREAELN
ncbi:MAG TPA: crotonase/enoyl-CoA hydratase family protein [Hyphomonadaceae bacterium]|nr:crotonase/enoyl-CoA hydratase family protein [Hyphomonadaceae bacterium]